MRKSALKFGDLGDKRVALGSERSSDRATSSIQHVEQKSDVTLSAKCLRCSLPLLVILNCILAASALGLQMVQVAKLPHCLIGNFPCGDANHNGRPEIYGCFADSLECFEYWSRDSFQRIPLHCQLSYGFVSDFTDRDRLGLARVTADIFTWNEDSIRVYQSPDSTSFPTDCIWNYPNGDAHQHYPTFVDLDGDGDMELAAIVSPSGVLVFRDTSDSYALVAVLTNPVHLRDWSPFSVADFDRDGLNELATGSTASNFLKAYEYTGLRDSYVLSAVCSTQTFQNLNVAAAHDMDQDGWPEIIVLGLYGPRVVLIYEATGHAQYECVWSQSINPAGLFASWISVGDVDGDKTEEFAVSNGGTVYLFKSAGVHNYQCVWSTDNVNDYVRLFDVNNDGRAELLFNTGGDSGNCVIYEDTAGLSQVSESKPTSEPPRLEVRPAVVRLGTSVAFSGLPEQSELSVYSAGGQLIRKQATGRSAAWTWDLTDQHGRRVPAGTYFAVVRPKGQSTTTIKVCVVD